MLDALDCNDFTGTLVVQASGGEGLQYSLDGLSFSNVAVFNNLPAGQYTFFVRNSASCEMSEDFEFVAPSAINIDNAIANATTCGQNNGSIILQANGGMGALAYQLNALPPQNSGQFDNLSPGSYTITIADEANCTLTQNFNIEGSTALQINAVDVDAGMHQYGWHHYHQCAKCDGGSQL
ncbi:MAG: hypothetical protein R2795_14710 [Saprospiraceae bacterium]